MEVSSKRRNWIKNAVIIFLVILLILTFFSNTIMNRSLPQVATQYVMPQTITTAIRGTGTVKANADYEVEFNGDRTVKSVAVRVGTEVAEGDVLFELYEEEDGQVQALREELENLKYNYRLALLNMTDTDYARENRNIADAKADLQELIAKRDSCYVTAGDISVASANVTSAEKAVEEAQEKVDKLNEQVGNAGGGDYSQLEALYDKLLKTKTDLDASMMAYEFEYSIFNNAVTAWAGKKASAASYDAFAKLLSDASAESHAEAKDKIKYVIGEYNIKNGTNISLPEEEEEFTRFYTAYNTIKGLTETHENAAEEYAKLELEFLMGSGVNAEKLKEQLKTANEELKSTQKALETAKKIFADLQQKQTDYESLTAQVKTSEKALEDMIFNLTEQKKNDNKALSRDQLALNRQKEEIEKKQTELDRLSTGEVVNTITAPVTGTVTQVNISAGKKTSAVGGALCVIEEKGRGYTLSIPITSEQSRKISIGDTGTIDTGWWWGNNITAILTAITVDPSNPQTSKLAHFSLEGDVNAGDQLTISINQRSAAYDMVVPSSAVREDSNGKYVLILEAKNTPLGSRYYAQRADIQVLAADDTNSAVAGSINAYEYVITSSSAPIKPGDMVRLSDQ